MVHIEGCYKSKVVGGGQECTEGGQKCGWG